MKFLLLFLPYVLFHLVFCSHLGRILVLIYQYHLSVHPSNSNEFLLLSFMVFPWCWYRGHFLARLPSYRQLTEFPIQSWRGFFPCLGGRALLYLNSMTLGYLRAYPCLSAADALVLSGSWADNVGKCAQLQRTGDAACGIYQPLPPRMIVLATEPRPLYPCC